MSTLDEVAEALGVLAFGYLGAQEPPSLAAFDAVRHSDGGRRILRERVMLLHCTTEYPAPVEDVNLRAMQTMRETFGLAVGYSDHTVGIGVSIAAVALGAVAIEKHFTLDRALPGPDHKASLEPGELAALVREVRGVEAALGSAVKEPAPCELGNRAVARRSLIAARAIAAGEPFSEAALGALRPGTGVSPMAYWSLLGRPATRAYQPGEPIES
jgi:N-acetylneuraminate synthase